MSSPPYSTYRISECLSAVMDEIEVNETMVKKRRRTFSLMECMYTLLSFRKTKTYIFGSQNESTTIPGLHSDYDETIALDDVVVIQNMNELKQGCHNLMMIRNENIQPGYCNLQNISKHFINNHVFSYCEVVDTKGRRLLRRSDNKMVSELRGAQTEIHGPALALQAKGERSEDIVYSYRGESLPHEVTQWLLRQRNCKWPTVRVLEDCERSGCFAVPKGSPETVTPEMEWIISTALQERYLMFSLNITQIRCFILMKIILKTFIDPYVEDVLTSFMCKNVLWYCITNSSQDWHTGNLFIYLQLCLCMLKERIVQRNCPHFIIPGNNLLTGRMTDSQQDMLLKIINSLITKGEQWLFEIQIDNIGENLKMKLNNIPYNPVLQRRGISLRYSTAISFDLVRDITMLISHNILNGFAIKFCFGLEEAIAHVVKRLLFFEQDNILNAVNMFPHNELDIVFKAGRLIVPLMRATLGSLLACADIVSNSAISNDALAHLTAGKEYDALSGRLKLISVLYCTGDLEKTKQELNQISKERLRFEVLTVCTCTCSIIEFPSDTCLSSFESKHEEAIKTNITFCTRFLHCEIPCVPHELRYEVLRSYVHEDRQFRTIIESLWMDTIVVNSICYYYFLQYKMGHFHEENVQQQALRNLAASARSDIPHKETSLNILGQCYEQESRHIEALQCYIDSLKHRPRNNAAKFLLCIQLYKLKLLKFV